MARCVVFCAGNFSGPLEEFQKDDYILSADGGYAHTERLGITPDLVLGDFDSLGYVPGDARVFPVEKDDTDAMLAVRAGLDKGCRQFLIYGGLEGPRLDHTVANFQTLQFLADRDAQGFLMGDTQLVTVLRNGTMRFPDDAEGIISIFCMGKDARGVSLSGMQYPLENGTLTAGFPLGVSNHLQGAASVTVEEGSLLIIYDRKNGMIWK